MPETNPPTVVAIALDKLVPFHDHPFVPYEGQRLEDMTLSIRANGVLALQFGMDKNTMMRYLHVYELSQPLKERVDNGEIGLCAAELLSHLRPAEQDALDALLSGGKRVSIKQAQTLREESEKGKLGAAFIKRVLEPGYYPDEKIKPVKLSHAFLAPYFSADMSEPEIEDVIAEALREYFGKNRGDHHAY
jgi:ParB family chromosome partitioning protein